MSFLAAKYIFVGIYLCGAIGYFIFMIVSFKDFCRDVASVEGRLNELYDIRRDEGGMNRFELEVFRRLSSNGYANAEIPGLRDDAVGVRRKLTLAYAVAAGLILLLFFSFT